jgi:hypothetical protein
MNQFLPQINTTYRHYKAQFDNKFRTFASYKFHAARGIFVWVGITAGDVIMEERRDRKIS